MLVSGTCTREYWQELSSFLSVLTRFWKKTYLTVVRRSFYPMNISYEPVIFKNTILNCFWNWFCRISCSTTRPKTRCMIQDRHAWGLSWTMHQARPVTECLGTTDQSIMTTTCEYISISYWLWSLSRNNIPFSSRNGPVEHTRETFAVDRLGPPVLSQNSPIGATLTPKYEQCDMLWSDTCQFLSEYRQQWVHILCQPRMHYATLCGIMMRINWPYPSLSALLDQ